MDNAIKEACETFKKSGAEPAMASVKEFFVKNQQEIKNYFDSKSLEDVEKEMTERIVQMSELLKDVTATKGAEVAKFLKSFEEFLIEEFKFREKQVKESKS